MNVWVCLFKIVEFFSVGEDVRAAPSLSITPGSQEEPTEPSSGIRWRTGRISQVSGTSICDASAQDHSRDTPWDSDSESLRGFCEVLKQSTKVNQGYQETKIIKNLWFSFKTDWIQATKRRQTRLWPARNMPWPGHHVEPMWIDQFLWSSRRISFHLLRKVFTGNPDIWKWKPWFPWSPVYMSDMSCRYFCRYVMICPCMGMSENRVYSQL